MTKEQTRKFIDAVEAAGVKTYEFDTDTYSHLYNNDKAIIKFDDNTETVYNIRNGSFGGSNNAFSNPLQIVAAWCEDIHEAKVAGNYDQIKSIAENLGLTLSDSDLKIMLDIDKLNYDIIPENGDYNRFVPLTKKQYDKLTPEEQEAYDKAKAEDDKAKYDYIGQNMAGTVVSNIW